MLIVKLGTGAVNCRTTVVACRLYESRSLKEISHSKAVKSVGGARHDSNFLK